ncbi:hypothetical protein B0H19DRAFT_1062302 [Mycena capillaripes]|nr:hypothetical protein B0H19DRAFT_1062302 [Mycena capillaripes]
MKMSGTSAGFGSPSTLPVRTRKRRRPRDELVVDDGEDGTEEEVDADAEEYALSNARGGWAVGRDRASCVAIPSTVRRAGVKQTSTPSRDTPSALDRGGTPATVRRHTEGAARVEGGGEGSFTAAEEEEMVLVGAGRGSVGSARARASGSSVCTAPAISRATLERSEERLAREVVDVAEDAERADRIDETEETERIDEAEERTEGVRKRVGRRSGDSGRLGVGVGTGE